MLYIAINRFKINRGKGNSKPSHTLYISHGTWDLKEDFSQWTKSEAFRSAHKNARGNRAPYQ
ncbi:MAG TPA: hypothetical protein EYQ55_05720 [Methylococcaceae bacterium]|nr:hypothetical protein [Methylococcaceae bacterium]HIL40551.1 hypothetical protein [Methylococcales bacterium]